MNLNYYDLYYTEIKKRDDKEFMDYDDEYENIYIIFNDFNNPNHYIARKNINEILR